MSTDTTHSTNTGTDLNSLIRSNDIDSILRFIDGVEQNSYLDDKPSSQTLDRTNKADMLNHVLKMGSIEYYADLTYHNGGSLKYDGIVMLDEEDPNRYDSDDETGGKAAIIDEWEATDPHLNMVDRPIDTEFYKQIVEYASNKNISDHLNAHMPLYKAVRRNDADLVTAIVQSGIDLNVPGYICRGAEDQRKLERHAIDTYHTYRKYYIRTAYDKSDSDADKSKGPGMVWYNYGSNPNRCHNDNGVLFSTDKFSRMPWLDCLNEFRSNENLFCIFLAGVSNEMALHEKKNAMSYQKTDYDLTQARKIGKLLIESSLDFELSTKMYETYGDAITRLGILPDLILRKKMRMDTLSSLVNNDGAYNLFSAIHEADPSYIPWLVAGYVSYENGYHPLPSHNVSNVFDLPDDVFDLFCSAITDADTLTAMLNSGIKKYYPNKYSPDSSADMVDLYLTPVSNLKTLDSMVGGDSYKTRFDKVCERAKQLNVTPSVTFEDLKDVGIAQPIVEYFGKYGVRMFRKYPNKQKTAKAMRKFQEKCDQVKSMPVPGGMWGLICMGTQDLMLMQPSTVWITDEIFYLNGHADDDSRASDTDGSSDSTSTSTANGSDTSSSTNQDSTDHGIVDDVGCSVL